MNRNAARFAIITSLGVALTGCNRISYHYMGDQRPDHEVSMIRVMSVVKGKDRNPDIVLSAWKFNGNTPEFDIIWGSPHAYAFLPSTQEVGVSLSLVTLLPLTVRQFSAIYWVPIESEPGYIYEFHAKLGSERAPSQVCAIRVSKNTWPLPMTEDMEMPEGATVVGCGRPRESIDSYSFRLCSIGTCPISDEYNKP